jgi:hypothetical protein
MPQDVFLVMATKTAMIAAMMAATIMVMTMWRSEHFKAREPLLAVFLNQESMSLRCRGRPLKRLRKQQLAFPGAYL